MSRHRLLRLELVLLAACLAAATCLAVFTGRGEPGRGSIPPDPAKLSGSASLSADPTRGKDEGSEADDGFTDLNNIDEGSDDGFLPLPSDPPDPPSSGAVSSGTASGAANSSGAVSSGAASGDSSFGEAVLALPLFDERDGVTLPAGDAPSGYLDGVYFFGDSTTYGLRYYRILGERNTPRVWTPKSGTIALYNATFERLLDPPSGQLRTLSEMAATYRPPVLVITLGINGVATMREDYFKGEYKKVIAIVRESSPETTIVLQSIYPVSWFFDTSGGVTREKIIEANIWIHDIALEEGCRFLYSYPIFLDEAGYLDEGLQNGDGMHLAAVGYRRMIDYLLAHPAQ